jgi:hypothetical protein
MMVFDRRSLLLIAAAFAFALGWISSADATEQATPVASPTIVASSDDAGVVWDGMKKSSDQSQLERFIKRYPDSPYAVSARIRLEMLRHPRPPVSASVVRIAKPASGVSLVTGSPDSATADLLLASHNSQLDCWGFWCGRQFPIVHGIGF